MNSLYQSLMGQKGISSPNNLSGVKNLMNMVKSAKNPQTMLQSMVNQNPQMKQVMDYVQQNGGDPKTAFYKLAEQRGVNPDEVLQMLK